MSIPGDASELFPTLSESEIACMKTFGVERSLEPGEVLFAEGVPADAFYVVLAGEIKVTRRVGSDDLFLVIHTPGHFTGEISLLSGGLCIATGRAVHAARVLEISASRLKALLVSDKPVAARIWTALVGRRPEADTLSLQRQKMASLGVMAAGLAHELNNPAAAGQRAAAQMRETFARQQQLALALHRCQLDDTQCQAAMDFQQAAIERAKTALELDPLEQSDREEILIEWLEQRDIADAWKVAPVLVRHGVTPEMLQTFAPQLPCKAVPVALGWLEASLSMTAMLNEVELSTQRVASLVHAIKSYSYMDQAAQQVVDVHRGIDDTLTLLNHKLKHTQIEIVKQYDPQLPCIEAFGSELNQVWTNLLSNAMEAMGNTGRICIRTGCERDCILVEIADNGPGIPPEIQGRIFEPFFTTKGIGKGTGLGLDICYKIVVGMHHGDLSVLSQPGDTRFQVRLPLLSPAHL